MKKAEREQGEIQEKEEKRSIGREVWEYVRMILIVVVAVVLVQSFLIINARIPSESMENTIMVGDQIFGNRLAYKFGDPQRFDIVIFRYPDDEKQLFVKRVIGLPGETVTIKDGKVYINDSEEPLDDSFCPETPLSDGDGVYQVPEDSYFMMGDNRNLSRDSRFWINKYVSRDKILGKAVLRYWPLNKIKLLN